MFHVDMFYIFCLIFRLVSTQLQEYKTKMQEVQADLQRQLQAAKKVCKLIIIIMWFDLL